MRTFDKQLILFVFGLTLFGFLNLFLPSYFNAKSTTIEIELSELFDNARFEGIIENRISHPVFGKRILVSYAVSKFSYWMGLPKQFIYNVINLFGIGILLFFLTKISKELHQDKYIFISLFFLLLYYPFLFNSCTMMAGFDDHIHWMFTSGVIYFYLRKSYSLSALFFLCALFTRETSLLLLSFLAYSIYKHNLYRFGIYLICAIAAYIFIISNVGDNAQAINFIKNERFFAVLDNVGNSKALVRTIVSFLNVFVVPYLLFYLIKEKVFNKDYFISLTLFVFCNTFIAFFTSLVDESRIWGYPLIFLIPFVGEAIDNIMWSDFRFIKKYFYLILILFGFSFFVFQACPSRSCIIYPIYTFLNGILIIKLVDCVVLKYTAEKQLLNLNHGQE